MSKAFIKESDSEGDDGLPSLRRQLPAGVSNYITPAGATRLRDDLAQLIEKKRQLAEMNSEASNSAQPEQRKLQSRIRQLQQILQSVVVAAPPVTGRERVAFGASVTIRQANGEEAGYRIVGVDESDPAQDQISWLSPLAKQLMGHAVGDRVRFRFPAGEEELEIVSVSYEQV